MSEVGQPERPGTPGYPGGQGYPPATSVPAPPHGYRAPGAHENSPYGSQAPVQENSPYGSQAPVQENSPYGSQAPAGENSPYRRQSAARENIPYGYQAPLGRETTPYGYPPPGGYPPPDGSPPPPGSHPPPTRQWPAGPPPRRRGPLGWLGTLLLVVLLVLVAAHFGKGLRGADPLSSLVAPPASSATVQPPPNAARGAPSRAELTALAEKVTPGIVDIYTELGYQNAESAGTGIVLSSDGEVLTNNHVINGATSIRVTALNNGRGYSADVVGYDRAHDIAVLRLHGASGLPTAVLGDSSSVQVGDPIAAIGNAGGAGAPTVSGGTVTALNRTVSPTDELTGSTERLTGLIEVAANVQPGQSGGPLVDAQGRVVGVDTAASANYRYQTSGGLGFAIPINSAMSVARQIDAGQGSDTVHVGPTGMLGVSVLSGPVNRDDPGSRSRGERRAAVSGVQVAGVQPDSPAEQAGLGRGDVIVAVDGSTVESATDLTNLLVRHHPGDPVRLQWVDGSGQRQDATATLVPGPPA